MLRAKFSNITGGDGHLIINGEWAKSNKGFSPREPQQDVLFEPIHSINKHKNKDSWIKFWTVFCHPVLVYGYGFVMGLWYAN